MVELRSFLEVHHHQKDPQDLQDTQVIQETRKNNPDEPVPAVSNKRSWNPEQLKRDLEAKDFVSEQKKVIDPKAIRIETLPFHITEAEV